MNGEAGSSPTPEKSVTPADEPYDCCFGMVCFPPKCTNPALLTTAPKLTVAVSCSHSLDKDFDSGPVTVTASGTTVRLFFAESNTFAALFEAPGLVKLVRHSGVTLEATLPKPEVKKKKGGKSSMALPVVAHIMVYGKRATMYEVGGALWDEDLHLQHPSVEIDPNVEYFNPQYLLAPGETFPRPVAAAAVSRTHAGPLDKVVRAYALSQLNQVFDGASGIQGGECQGVVQSDRLRTILHE